MPAELLLCALGAGLVVGLTCFLRLLPGVVCWHTGPLLAISHTLIVCVWLAISPLYIAAERKFGSDYGDVFVPYMLVPGVHIYHPANLWFGQIAFPRWLGHMESFPASVICVIIGPALVGSVAGGLQWYIIGAIWERWARSTVR